MEHTINTDDYTAQQLEQKHDRTLEMANDALEAGDFDLADELVDVCNTIDSALESRGDA